MQFTKQQRGPCLVIGEFLDNVALQMFFYVLFLVSFQALVAAVRSSSEFYLVNQINNIWVNNCFDSDHNAFMDIRRTSDVWEWGNNVFIPGLFSNAGTGENWPDGYGDFSLQGASPYRVKELRHQMNYIDFTEGIMLRQARAPRGKTCAGNHPCFQKLAPGSGGGFEDPNLVEPGDRTTYSKRGDSNAPKFYYKTARELGSEQVVSASIVSSQYYPAGGFFAALIPFFSDTYLPYQNGTYTQVTDYRLHVANYSNTKDAKYYCVRTTLNGVDIEQVCDPNSGPDGNANMVRTQATKWINELKKNHWIDFQTRYVLIQMQLKNPNGGFGVMARLQLEFPPQGGVLPSTNIRTRLMDEGGRERLIILRTWLYCTAAMVFFLIIQEIFSMYVHGIKYWLDFWNILDWANFLVFFLSWNELERVLDGKLSMNARCMDIAICEQVGFYDDWAVFKAFNDAKYTLGFNSMLQLMKIIKFTNVLIPKMGLLTRTLQHGAADLSFFTFIFALTMFAFANLFYVIIGSYIDDYYSLDSSFLSLFRALFGDFDVSRIEDISTDKVNTFIFMVYLFAAVFILLSMFLAILGEAQNVATDAKHAPVQPYGVLTSLYETLYEIKPAKPSVVQLEPGKSGNITDKAEVVPGADDEVDEQSAEASKLEEAKMLELDQRMRQLERLCSTHEHQLKAVIKDTARIVDVLNKKHSITAPQSKLPMLKPAPFPLAPGMPQVKTPESAED